MRRATLITGLITHEVPQMGYAKYIPPMSFQDFRPIPINDDELILAPMTVTEHVVPITQFCRPGRPDTYIAYSHEVEDLLGVPIRVLLKEKDAAYAELNVLRSMTAWQHVKAAWRLLLARLNGKV